MKARSKLVWKLTAVVAAILTVAVALAAYAHRVDVAVASLLLGVVAARFMFALLLDRPIRKLIAGTNRIAAHQLDHRFDRSHRDEIGVLEESFHAMAATIQASQDELRDAKEYLEGMVEHSADIIIAVNSEGLIETFNRGGEEALGYRREEVIGKRIESLYVDPRDRQAAAARLETAGDVMNYETRLRAKDGSARNVLLTLSRLRDGQGKPIGTIGISKDITAEKKLQDELRDAREYLEGMVEHSADIIIAVNSEGLIETFNRGGEEALGYRREEVIGKRIESLYVDPRDRQAAAARLETAGDVMNYETRLRAKDGSARNVLLTLSRLRDGQGRLIGSIGISKDITAEKKLQDELRDAREYLEGMVEHSADIIITVNSEGLIETFNRGGEEALGYRREEVIGKRIESLYVDPRDRQAAAARLETAGDVMNYETRLRAKDGSARNVLLTLSRLRDGQGRLIGTIGISKDITAEKKLQDELRDAREYLEGMVEHSADIIIAVNSEGLIETFNRGGEEALGYRREEVIGKRIESLYVDPRDRQAAAARLETAGDVMNYETRLRAKDGSARNVLLTLSRLRDSQGKPIGSIGISKDITQEKKLQDELRDAKEYMEGIVESSADIIITVNLEGSIETFNRGGEETLGYHREELIGKRIESLFADPRERDIAVNRLRDTDNVRNYETRFLAKDGQVRNVLLTLSRLRDRGGDPIGTFGISKDITQEKKLLRELVQSQKFAAIGQAVTGIQHAIKNMLNSLKGGAYLVRNGMAKGDRQQVEEGRVMVEEGIDRISSLSHHTLNFAREWKPVLQRVDVGDLVASICTLNRPTAADRGVALRHRATAELTPVLCDPTLIHMATTDILVNAIDACTWKNYSAGETPEVVLESSWRKDGDFCVIEVRDNGCGMTEAVRRNIFDPFFSTKKTLGTGLGLAVTAKIVRVHEGEISVETEPDRGTTFRIHIPKDGPKDGRGDG